ncbi:MAG: hypothetical protein M3384_21750, partial [Acidobacteriota bacterium]|nr:hypothetical protein [Acidobacteriota bacterium]
MEKPIIALRFRELTPNILTIEEHRSLLKRFDKVWWGWWRKAWESKNEEEIKELFQNPSNRNGLVYLVNRETKEMFKAHYQQVLLGDSVENTDLIPEYYRNADGVAAWFLLTEIKGVKYNRKIAEMFGDETFLNLSKRIPVQELRGDTFAPEKSTTKPYLLHLSDIHFGK